MSGPDEAAQLVVPALTVRLNLVHALGRHHAYSLSSSSEAEVVIMADQSLRADPNTVYALGQNPEESARLQRQADELAPESTMVLDQTGLAPGQSALDLGCGPRGVLDLLADRVGSDGSVVGVDADSAHVAMATEYAAGRGFENIRVLMADARDTGLPSGSFDVVHARTLLVTVPEPAVVATEMARLTRPGGWVASVEPDTEYMVCYPKNAAFDRISAFNPPFSAATEPTRGSADASLNCSDRPAWRTSACRQRPRHTPPGTPAGPSGLTFSRASDRKSWRWDWRAQRSWTN
jgi:SAM-dependent methyltransferase